MKPEDNPKISEEQIEIPDILALLPIRDLVIYPLTIAPLIVSRDISKEAIEDAIGNTKDRLIFLATQKDINEEFPGPESIYHIGCIGMILRMARLNDGTLKILVQGLMKARILEFTSKHPLKVKLEKIDEPAFSDLTLEVEALIRNIRELMEKFVALGKNIPPEISMIINSLDDPGRIADLVAANISMKIEDSQNILEIIDPCDRLKRVSQFLQREIEVLTVQAKIQTQAKEEMQKIQKDYYLREQMKQIKNELGEFDAKSEEVQELKIKISELNLPEECKNEAFKQLKRYEQMNQDSAEASMIRTYLDWIVELPWNKSTVDNIDIKKAKVILDQDHYDLTQVKERILEYLGVRKLKADKKGPVLCFVGPPGVGKTSLGKSIAASLGRKFVRISLGGLRDEAEIRGHRRTYVGALPGKIIQGMKLAQTSNPVFVLDEIDKIGSDFRGDPASALLEVLDPEQNHAFRDHYLNLPFDLSKVIFIATANIIDPIPPALKDRMEVIEITSYSEDEKLHIAKKYLIPRQIEENGVAAFKISLSDNTIRKIIGLYTRESGVRSLERSIGTICRKIAKNVAEEKDPVRHFKITAANLQIFLGIPKNLATDDKVDDIIGVATGLAWTQTGGEILYIESTAMKGKSKLILTGQLGEVMKESAQIALSFVRSNCQKYGIDDRIFDELEIHIHIPSGAIPKDGPSAGIALLVSLISLLSKIPVRKSTAMTGEITLRGRVLPIGGIKEKVLAAIRSNLEWVILPEQNKNDFKELPAIIQKQINVKFVKQIDDAVHFLFTLR